MCFYMRSLIGFAFIVLTSCSDWIFPDKLQFDLADVLNKKCGDTPYSDRFKPEDGRMFENPWLVMFRHPEDPESFCQGTLITEQHVLTTVICTEAIVVNETIVVLGEYDRSIDPDCDLRGRCNYNPVIELQVQRVIAHPNFMNDSYENDIALITLSKRVNYSDNISPICLPLTPIIPSHIHDPVAYNTLWTEESSRPKQILMKYIPHESCQHFTQGLLALHEGQICAKYEMRIAARLIGGSGSPLLIEHHDHAFQLGMLSIGLPDATYVEPYVYVNISTHIKWIHDTLLIDVQQ